MKKHNLAFIDLETTGTDPERHEIVEIGCLIAKQVPRPGKGPTVEMIEAFDIKVQPEHIETAEPEALQINGYNSADWLFAVSLPQALKMLADKTGGAIMVAQNVTFDWNFLNKAFAKTGIANPMHFPKIDLISMAFAKLYHDERVQRFGLGALTDHFGLKNDQAHTALADIKVTFEIYKKLLDL